MQITVKKIFAPFNATDESGAFIGTDDNKYYLDIASHRMLVEGLTIEANAVKTFSKKTGKPYFNIKGGFDPVVEGQGQSPSAKDDFVRANANRLPDAVPRPAANGSPPPYFSEVHKSGYIFVTGCLQQALGSGKIEAKDIPFVAETLVAAWNDHIKGKI
jgi:hypothetical protein